jgi:hypothetical protein
MSNYEFLQAPLKSLPEDLKDLIGRCYEKKPDKKDLRELRRWLEETPDLWRSVIDMTALTRQMLIEKIISQEAAQAGLWARLETMQQELGYKESPLLERLLIENVVLTWLRLQWVEGQVTGFMGQQARMAILEYWEKRLSAAQRRHLRACETLARVRRLARNNPALQVNIATRDGQQVNIAGDFVKSSEGG